MTNTTQNYVNRKYVIRALYLCQQSCEDQTVFT